MALLEIDRLPLRAKSIKLANKSLRHGQIAYAVGNSQNHGIGISKGIISVPLIRINYNDVVREVIQIDITITNGNSGGALLSDKGKLIGITTFRVRDSLGQVVFGLAYAIPIDVVMMFLNS